MRIVLEVSGEQKNVICVEHFLFFSENKPKKEMKASGKKTEQKKLNKERKPNGKEKQTLFSLSKGRSDPNIK
jgi:hypothetical protein